MQSRPIRTCFQRPPGQTSSMMTSGVLYSHTVAAISLTDPSARFPSASTMLWVGWSPGVTTWLMWPSMELWQGCLPRWLACCSERAFGACWPACFSPLTPFTLRRWRVLWGGQTKVPPCSSCCPYCATYATVSCGATRGSCDSWRGSWAAWAALLVACCGRSWE